MTTMSSLWTLAFPNCMLPAIHGSSAKQVNQKCPKMSGPAIYQAVSQIWISIPVAYTSSCLLGHCMRDKKGVP